MSPAVVGGAVALFALVVILLVVLPSRVGWRDTLIFLFILALIAAFVVAPVP